MNSTNATTILDQFTKQALPFAEIQAHSAEDAMNLLLTLSGVSKSSQVLDVACGPGIVACAFAERAGRVTGIDLTPAMIDQAAKMQQEKGLFNLEWNIGDVTKLPYSDASFDIVVSRYAFHHFTEPKEVFSEMVRVCKNGGYILIADVAPEPEKIKLYDFAEKLRDESHASALSTDMFLELAEKHKLQDIITEYYGLDIAFETLMKSAYMKTGDEEKLRELISEDIGKNRIGLGAHLKGKEIYYNFPVVILKGKKV